MLLRKTIRQEWLLLTLIILVSLSSQIIFIRPVTLSDQMVYYRTAVNFPRLPEHPNHWSMRLGLILPVAVLYRIFGHSEIVYYFLPIISTIVFITCIYLLGKTLFSRAVGLSAALWVSFLPYFLSGSGNLLPDITASACLTAGITLIIWIKDKPSLRRAWWYFFITGMLFGWAYLTKEYFALFAIIVPGMFWMFKIPRKHLVPYALGALTIISIEFIIHYLSYDNALIRLSTIQPRETIGFIQYDALKIISNFFILLSKYRSGISVAFAALGLAYLILMALKKSHKHIFLIIWFILIYVVFTILGLMPVLFQWQDQVLLRLHLFRYWTPLLPPLAIGGAAAFESCLDVLVKLIMKNNRIASQLGSTALIACVIGISAGPIDAVHGNNKFTLTGSNHYIELRNFLADSVQAPNTIWIVRDMKIGYENVLPIYANTPLGKDLWQGRMKYLNTNGVFLKADEIRDGSVLIDRAHFNPDYYPIPQYLADPPDNWQLIFKSSNRRLAIYDVK